MQTNNNDRGRTDLLPYLLVLAELAAEAFEGDGQGALPGGALLDLKGGGGGDMKNIDTMNFKFEHCNNFMWRGNHTHCCSSWTLASRFWGQHPPQISHLCLVSLELLRAASNFLYF